MKPPAAAIPDPERAGSAWVASAPGIETVRAIASRDLKTAASKAERGAWAEAVLRLVIR
ncbi:MAG: hypothetical protein WC943_08675 [Elusimicrobiota bacterium]